MIIRGMHIKKRYIAIGIIALIVLVKCSSKAEEAPPEPKPITLSQYQQNDGYQDVSRQDPQTVQFSQPAPAAQPVIVNNVPAQDNNSGFINGVILGHVMSHSNGGYASSSRTVINRNYTTTNHYHAPAAAAPAPKYSSSFARRPSTSYSTPAPRYMTKTNGYSRSSGYRPASRASSFRSRR